MKDRASVAPFRDDRLAGISEERRAITRPYGSPAMREVNDLVSDWIFLALPELSPSSAPGESR